MSPRITGCGRAIPDDIVRTNVEGTRTVMNAALAAGVERIVYTSSVATLASRPDRAPSDETFPLAAEDAVGAYKYSKVMAERLVEAMVAEQKLPAVIVNPSTPIGPGDVRPTPTGRIIIEAAAGRMPAYVDTGLNLVHVDDVAAGHVAALHKGRIGERYILGGQDVLLGDMLRDIARRVGRSPPKIRLPRQLIFPIAYGAEAIAHFTGREPFVTTTGLKLAKDHMFFTSAKAERELGYQARPYGEAVAEAIAWFRQHGYLKADTSYVRGAALAQEVKELDAFAQPPLHHLRTADHLADDRGDLAGAEIEAPVKFLDRSNISVCDRCG